ncbi:MAG: hypothetical protein L0Y66_01720 [Myxococcaceae bacterium]|nr:hypothetical protein [Myxococcaceae bacterium]MCI0670139.1 hypothetical protein [Myxococcaceae bacterium]
MSMRAFAGLAFLRDQLVSPWLGARINWSRSSKLDEDASPSPRYYSSSNLALALGLGADLQLHQSLGLIAGAYVHTCDIDYSPENLGECAPFLSIAIGPRVRF